MFIQIQDYILGYNIFFTIYNIEKDTSHYYTRARQLPILPIMRYKNVICNSDNYGDLFLLDSKISIWQQCKQL